MTDGRRLMEEEVILLDSLFQEVILLDSLFQYNLLEKGIKQYNLSEVTIPKIHYLKFGSRTFQIRFEM